MANTLSLSKFLALNRSKYLDDLKSGNSQGWTVVTGNEAGDLDSAASSIAYSYLASNLFNRPTIALLQTARTDLLLRAENIYAYDLAQLQSNQTDLLCIDDIPTQLLPRLSSFALVDHNRLSPRFPAAKEFSNPPNVMAIIDHHEDEGFHREANPRIITVPVGSCASMVTQYFSDSWVKAESSPPAELASLLLCAIFIDTRGLKSGGKAVAIDRNAAKFLLPKSTFASLTSHFGAESTNIHEDLRAIISRLDERKQSVTHLSSRDLLRRDYKEYTFNSPLHSSSPVTIGIATVPLSPKRWLHKESSPEFWQSMDAWMEEQGLGALGALCTYNSLKNGQHRRQIIWIVARERGDLVKALWEGLEASAELELERRDMGKNLLSEGVTREPGGNIVTSKGSIARIWKQRNASATRKVVAPLVKRVVEGAGLRLHCSSSSKIS